MLCNVWRDKSLILCNRCWTRIICINKTRAETKKCHFTMYIPCILLQWQLSRWLVSWHTVPPQESASWSLGTCEAAESITHNILQCSPQAKFKAQWEAMVWAGLMTTSKHLKSHHSHIKEISALKACWANMLKGCWGEHCTTVNIIRMLWMIVAIICTPNDDISYKKSTEIFLLLAMAIAKSVKCCRVSLPLI